MRSQQLAPGRLAHLISALYESTSGVHAAALHDASASSRLQVLVSTQHMPQDINRYNISAALLAPTYMRPLSLSNWATGALNSSSCSTKMLLPTAAAQSLHQPLWSSAQLGVRAACSTQQNNCSSTSSLAASTALSSSDTSSPTGCSAAPSRRSCCNSSFGQSSSHQRPLLPVYLIIAGIGGGFDQHLQAARQLYSQADFFVCATPGSFWHRIAKALNHGLEVPDLLQQPLEGFLVPWLKALHEQNMLSLTQQGYAGLEVVLSGHSLGGFLADSAALMLPHSFPQQHMKFSSVTFDSPGIPAVVMKQYGVKLGVSYLSAALDKGHCEVLQQGQLVGNCSKAAEQQQSSMRSSATFAATESAAALDYTATKHTAAATTASDTAASVGLPEAEAASGAMSAGAALPPNLRMVSYLASPTPLNTLFRHPGLLYHVMVNSQQDISTFDVLAYSLIDAARCFFLYDAQHCLLGLINTELALLSPVATSNATSDATSINSTPAATAAGVVTAAAVSGTSAELTAAAAAVSFSTAALVAGAFGSLAGRLGLGAVDLVEQHSLDGMRFRAFDPESGDPCEANVQQMESWPRFTPGSEIRAVVADVILGLLPSFVWWLNRGVWTLWEGKAARSRRVLKWRPGYVPLRAPRVVSTSGSKGDRQAL